MFGTIPATIPDTTSVITPPTTQTDTTVIPTETPIIAPTIPPSPDYTPASPDYSPASVSESDPSKDPSSDHIPPLPATSPFLSSDDDTTDSDTPDIPPSPTYGAPFTEITFSTQRSLVIPRRRVMILAPGQPNPYGRPYRYHLNGPIHMMTARKRVGPLPTHRLAVRHSVDYSSSGHFSSDDSSSSSSSNSSSETSSDPSSDDLSDSSFGHSLAAPSSSMRPSHHLCSLVPSVPCSSVAISDRPSHDSSSASPSRKRSISMLHLSPESATDLEVSSAEGSEPSRYKGTELEMDDDVERSDEIDIDPEIQAEIDEYIAYVDALRDRGINARVIVEVVDREEIEVGARGPVEVRVDRVTHLV
ncbi:hypothetical protein Tco_0591967, partial [Tanacetum coccineum]